MTSPALTPHARNIALAVAAALFAQFLDGVIIVTALPRMARDFNVSTLDMSVGVTIYMLTVTICIPAAAWLADRFGAKRMFLASIAAFTLASIACGAAQTFEQFVMARALQGVGGAVLFPVGRILVLRSAQKSEIVSAIGLTIWPALFAPVLGPALGGLLTDYASWQWNFWINIPLGLVNFALVWRIVPDDGALQNRPFDTVGFLLCGVTFGATLYGFDFLVQGNKPISWSIALLGCGLAGAIAATLWLLRAPHPLVNLRTLKVPTFAMTDLTAGALVRVGINSAPFLLPLMFQVGFGLNAFAAGSLVVAYFLGNLVMKSVTTPILRRFGFRAVLWTNGLLAGISLAACALLTPESNYGLVVTVLFAAGATRSMQFTALATLAFADIGAEQRSSATTISSMSQQLSMMFGVAAGAGLLTLSRIGRGEPALGLWDFHAALIAMGAIICVTSLAFLTLGRDAGAEVSGHR